MIEVFEACSERSRNPSESGVDFPQSPVFRGDIPARTLLERVSTAIRRITYRCREGIPPYWENSDKDLIKAQIRSDPDFFDDHFPVRHQEFRVLQALLDNSAYNAELSLRLIRAVRIENGDLWFKYQKRTGKMQRQRGKCSYMGRGAPSSVQSFDNIPGLKHFTQDLDPDICEAYLWHGTTPDHALKIYQKGFLVDQHSKYGKRFGEGGYFSEDPAQADKYAGAGRGLYHGCFAMLLCRVALGTQNHLRQFRDPGATERAKGRYDSTLAEPMGSNTREFVVFDGNQIYPEYALVYERVPAGSHHDELMYGSFPRSVCSTVPTYPSYWHHTVSQHLFFHDTCPAESIKPILQALMDIDCRDSFRVLKVLRVECSTLWGEYIQSQDNIRHRRSWDGIAALKDVKTLQSLPQVQRGRLAHDVNEVYLWHGSSPETIIDIAQHGFPIQLKNFNHGMYGDGAYLVEDVAHADEFSKDEAKGYYKGYFAMLLCRVTLGRVLQIATPDCCCGGMDAQRLLFDSIVGRVGHFREFVVPQRAQIYPEYAIIYERL